MEQREIRMDNVVYCVQRHYSGTLRPAEIIAQKILETEKAATEIDAVSCVGYNNHRKLVQGGKT